jgi:hypothetical protein
MPKAVKLILSILLFLCLFDWPYGYYQFVRFCAMLGFTYLAYVSFLEDQKIELVIFLLLTLMFQPLHKISLGRTLWNAVDVLVGLGLIVSYLSDHWSKKNN